jgi:hypothetical protein
MSFVNVLMDVFLSRDVDKSFFERLVSIVEVVDVEISAIG